MKKKIVFAIGSLSGGGAERVISILSNHLAQDYEVTILAIFKDEVAYDLSDNVTYKVVDLPETLVGIRRNFSRLKKIRQLIIELEPHLVISFLTSVNLFVLLAMLFTKVPIIVSERNDPDRETPNKLMRLVRNFLYRFKRQLYFVFQTDYASSRFPFLTEARKLIIFNPLKSDLPSPYHGIREDRIVCVARLEKAKNIAMLIRAFNVFRESYPNYILELYGVGTQEEELRSLVANLNLEQQVHFKGFSKTIHEQILKARMFVLPSDYEGIANAMLEALAIGLPTICTDCPAYGGRLFIEQKYSGFLIPVGDEKQLIDKMLVLASDDNLSQTFSKNSISIREILNEANIIGQWRKVIEEVGHD